jgi:hypothetical protein
MALVAVGQPTENGWPRINADKTSSKPVPGTDIRIPLAAGIPDTIIKAFLAAFHQACESLYNARGATDEGGWTPGNNVWNSNHLSGTAVDVNWSDHIFRIHNSGFTAAEIAVVRELLAFFTIDGIQLIFWGNDWENPRDAMHFQMGYKTNTPAGIAACNKFIRQFIRADGFSTFRIGNGNIPANPAIPRKLVVPAGGGTFWNDVSQYQGAPIGAGYGYKVFSFRTNSGSKRDTLALENARAAKQMLTDGDLAIVIPYYFFRPGQANCDLHREILVEAGLFNHPRTVTMVDVEGDNGSVTGDNSWEINDEVNRLIGWYGGNRNRVIGYLNSNADPGIWRARQGINLVVPQYGTGRKPGDISTITDAQVKVDAIAHQFTDRATDQKPWAPNNVDVNWSPYNVDELLILFGMKEGPKVLNTDQMVKELWDRFIGVPWSGGKWPSTAWFRDHDDGVGDGVALIRFAEGSSWDQHVVDGAMAGNVRDIERVRKVAEQDDAPEDSEEAIEFAKAIYAKIPKAAKAKAVKALGGES